MLAVAAASPPGAVAAAITAIDADAWRAIDYTPDGQAQVAETVYRAQRLVVRRTRLTDRRQLKLWPDWRHFAFLTDLDGDAVAVDAFHREHATVELDIRDLKEGAGLEHVPSGTSAPTAPGSSARCSLTTSSAGRRRSASPHRLIGARWPARSASGSSTSPAASSTGRAPDPARPAPLAVAPLVLPTARCAARP
jgi:hypothetical protein